MMDKCDVLVLFASQTGNAESVAQALARQVQAYAVHSVLRSMGEVGVEDLRCARDVLLVVSTCGNGDMPDSAQELWQAVQTQAPDLQGVHFAVLALGDCLYDHFCAAGKAWDARLAELGAARLRARVDCDVEFEADAGAWREALLSQLAALRGWTQREVVEVEEKHYAPGYHRDAPLTVPLRARSVLTGKDALREVVHVEIAIEADVTWTAGDLFYVWPENEAALVEEVITALGARGADVVSWQGKRERLDVLLTREIELRTPSSALLEALELPAVAGQDVLDCLHARPILDAQDALELLKPLTPRAYSLANVPGADHHLALTVGRVRYDARGRHYHGAASNYLATLPPGEHLRGYFFANPYFSVPEDPDAAVIMIATGTGIAPFRAFLQQRAQDGAPGKNWLFFGDRYAQQDFLYGNEMKAWQKSGVLTHLSLAFSRDQAEKVYVQHLLRAQGAEIFAWLEAGASVFVCGNAQTMAHDVDSALHDVKAEHGKMRAANAAAYIARLKNDKRYVRDVY